MRTSLVLVPALAFGVLGVACNDSGSADHACAYYSGPGFDDAYVCYDIDGELAVIGDMILGKHAELQEQNQSPRNAVGGSKYYWPKGRVPYTIAADVPMDLKNRIADSIADYTNNTPVRWVPKQDSDKDWVEIVMAGPGANFGGRSYLGRRGGKQELELTAGLVGQAHAHHTVRHEMGHAVGLTHEQVRPDRDEWITVNMAMIAADWRAQYQIHGGNVLTYDYDSIMHYRLDLDNDGRNEMVPLHRNNNLAAIGNGLALSQGDIYDLGYLYSDWEVYWQSLGNTALADIQVVTNDDGRLEVFGLRGDGSLWHIWQVKPRAGWSGWEELGGGNRLLTIARNGDGRLEAFTMAGDQLWHRWQVRRNGTWSDWSAIGDPIGGVQQIVSAKNRDGRLEVFARRQSGELVHVWQDKNGPGGWSAWSQLTDAGATDLAVKENRDGRIEVAWVGPGGSVAHMWQKFGFGGGISWEGPAGFDHAPSGAVRDIEIARNKDGHLEVFATLASGAMEHAWYNRGWSQWVGFSNDGGQTVAEYDHDGKLEVFKLVGGHVFHRWQSKNSGGDWSDWEKMPGSPGDVTKIAVARNEDRGLFDKAYLELFAIRRDGGGVLFHTWRTGRELGIPGNGGGSGSCTGLQDDASCPVGTSGDASTGDWSTTGEGTTGDGSTTGDGTTGDGTTGDGTTGDASTTGGSLTDGTTSEGDTYSTGDRTTGEDSFSTGGSFTTDASTTREDSYSTGGSFTTDASTTGEDSFTTSGGGFTTDGSTTREDSWTDTGWTSDWTGGWVPDVGSDDEEDTGYTTWSPDLGVDHVDVDVGRLP